MGNTEVAKFLGGPNGVTQKIKQAMYDVAKQFVYIGFLLWEVQQYGYYREHGHNDVYEYAAFELNLKKTTVKNLIGINKAFGQQNQYGLRTMYLQQEYEKFNYSQLTEMLSMSETQRNKVKPDMTIRQIREIKKEPEFELEPGVETIPLQLPESKTEDQIIKAGQTSDQVEQQTVTINNIWKELPPDIVKAIVKAAGLKYYKKGCYDITIELHKKN